MAQISRIAETYKIFSNPSRLKIIKLLLNNKELSVNSLAKKISLSQSAVSQHLKIMRQARLVLTGRKSFNILYSLNKKQLALFNGLVNKVLGRKFLAK